MKQDKEIFFGKLDELRVQVMKKFLMKYSINYDKWTSIQDALSSLDEAIDKIISRYFHGELDWSETFVAHNYLKGLTVNECISIFMPL